MLCRLAQAVTLPEPFHTGAVITSVIAVALILTELALLRARTAQEEVALYALQSLAIAVFAGIAGIAVSALELIILSLLTAVIKVVLVPLGLSALLRRIGAVETEIAVALNIPLTLLLGVTLVAISYGVTAGVPIAGTFLPQSALAVSVAVLLIGFLQIATRRNAISQLIGLLTLENGIFFGTVALAPQLPLTIGLLILFDVLIAVIVFGILIRLLAVRHASISTTDLNRLRG
jgi:hydrogenase-4 component E